VHSLAPLDTGQVIKESSYRACCLFLPVVNPPAARRMPTNCILHGMHGSRTESHVLQWTIFFNNLTVTVFTQVTGLVSTLALLPRLYRLTALSGAGERAPPPPQFSPRLGPD